MNDFLNQVIGQIHMFPLWSLILFTFFSACIQQFFPPYPSEVLLLFLGALAQQKVISGPFSIIPYILGTIVSSLFLFYISRTVGKPILRNEYIRKIFSKRNQRRAGVYMRRYGAPALAVCKFLPGVNTVCLIIGGVMGLRGIVPVMSITIAGIVENSVYFVAGWAIGNNMPALYSFSRNFSLAAALVAIVLIAIYLIVKFRRKILKTVSIAFPKKNGKN